MFVFVSRNLSDHHPAVSVHCSNFYNSGISYRYRDINTAAAAMTMATLNIFEKTNQEVMFGDFGRALAPANRYKHMP